MTKKQLKIIIGSIIILAQVVLYKNYIPFLTNKIIITNQWCTCPNARVLIGKSHLKSIAPDSLKKYNIDYSEMYIENKISTPSDPMGAEYYIVTGEIIGKESISEGDKNYYPLFRIDNYHSLFLHKILRWFIWGLLLFEFFILFRLVKQKMNDV